MTAARTFAAAALLVGAGILAGLLPASDRMPACQEDAVILGVGDFDASGHWSAYVCGPAVDDYSAAHAADWD